MVHHHSIMIFVSAIESKSNSHSFGLFVDVRENIHTLHGTFILICTFRTCSICKTDYNFLEEKALLLHWIGPTTFSGQKWGTISHYFYIHYTKWHLFNYQRLAKLDLIFGLGIDAYLETANAVPWLDHFTLKTQLSIPTLPV